MLDLQSAQRLNRSVGLVATRVIFKQIVDDMIFAAAARKLMQRPSAVRMRADEPVCALKYVGAAATSVDRKSVV